MASVKIPTRNDLDDWSIVVELDGATYQLRFCWNIRDNGWVLDIRDGEGVAKLTGRAIRVNVPINGLAHRAGLPPGYLLAIDTSGEGAEITEREDLSERVQLLYVPEADL